MSLPNFLDPKPEEPIHSLSLNYNDYFKLDDEIKDNIVFFKETINVFILEIIKERSQRDCVHTCGKP
jgi:hypothetical protein